MKTSSFSSNRINTWSTPEADGVAGNRPISFQINGNPAAQLDLVATKA
jgi:hypothetical protein